MPPPLSSPASTTALNNLPSSSYHELPDLTSSPSRRSCAISADTDSDGGCELNEQKGQSEEQPIALPALQIEYQSERQQLTCRIQTASTRAHLSLTHSTGGARVTEPTPSQIADLLSTDEKSTLGTDVHMATPEQLAKRYDTDLTRGLSSAKVSALQLQYGANVLTPPLAQSYVRLFLNQLVAGFSILLWVAAVMILLSWQPLGSIGGAIPQLVNLGVAVVLVIVILISALFNFYQEVRATQIVAAFANMLPSTAHVIRDGREMEVLASELVPGDIVRLVMGDKVPADVRLLSVSGLQLSNSALTGESEPVVSTRKSTSLNYLESHNLGFHSALIVQGRGTGLVTAIGDRTVLGQVSQLTQTNSSTDTNLHREIRRFVLFIAVMALSTGSLAFIMWGTWLYRAYPAYMPVTSIVTNAFSLIVAYVPSGLPVCVTLTLTMVAKRLYKQRVLSKNLPIIETFNSVSIICTDKTGTLTLNKMTVQQVMWATSGSAAPAAPASPADADSSGTADSTSSTAVSTSSTAVSTSSTHAAASGTTSTTAASMRSWSPPADDVSASDAMQGSEWVLSQSACAGSSLLRQLCVGAALCSLAEAALQADGSVCVRGDAVDVALYTLLRTKLAVNVLGVRQMAPRLHVQPFSSASKCSITRHATADGGAVCYMKGAPELVVDRCSRVAEERGDGSCSVVELTADRRAGIVSVQERCGMAGYRLIGLCRLEQAASSGSSGSGSSSGGESGNSSGSSGNSGGSNSGSHSDGSAASTATSSATSTVTSSAHSSTQPQPDTADSTDGTTEAGQLPSAGYTFLGLFALLDPPRVGVADSVRRAHAAGIRVAMVTGDHPSTAQAIAAQVGILSEQSVRAGVRRVRLQADELGRAVMQVVVGGAVLETHVLGTQGGGRGGSGGGSGGGSDGGDGGGSGDDGGGAGTQDAAGTGQPAAADGAVGASSGESVSVELEQAGPTVPTGTAAAADSTPPPGQLAATPPPSPLLSPQPPSSPPLTQQASRSSSSSWWSGWWQRQFGTSSGSSLAGRVPPIPYACVLHGSELCAFDAYMWSWALRHRELLFARTSPEHKLLVVTELQRRGEVVAVTGDGTNDGPALKQADCGVAMQAGAEVAREAADLVLLDNNFASIVEAIAQGRLVHDNLKKAALYLLPGGSFSEMWPVIFNVFLGVPLALSSFYMIIICVVTDVFNALAIVQEKPEAALMTRPPTVVQDNHLVDWRLLWHAYVELGTICSLSAWFNFLRFFQSRGMALSDTFFAWSWGSSSCCPADPSAASAASDPSAASSQPAASSQQCQLSDPMTCYTSGGRIFTASELLDLVSTGQSIFFVSLLLTNVAAMYSTRTRYTSALQHNPLVGAHSNRALLAATVAGSVVAVGLTQLAWFHGVFLTRPVAVADVAPALGFGAALLVFDEARKWVVRNRPAWWWAKTAW